MINVLDNWMIESAGNFNIIVAVITAIHIISLSILFYVSKKFGKPDERTSIIYLRVGYTMLGTQLLMNALFILWVDSSIKNSNQIFLIFQSIVFLVGAIYSFMLYRKDFK